MQDGSKTHMYDFNFAGGSDGISKTTPYMQIEKECMCLQIANLRVTRTCYESLLMAVKAKQGRKTGKPSSMQTRNKKVNKENQVRAKCTHTHTHTCYKSPAGGCDSNKGSKGEGDPAGEGCGYASGLAHVAHSGGGRAVLQSRQKGLNA
eukprot:1150715-Pelagomonas_calceolata.AAC.2